MLCKIYIVKYMPYSTSNIAGSGKMRQVNVEIVWPLEKSPLQIFLMMRRFLLAFSLLLHWQACLRPRCLECLYGQEHVSGIHIK